MFQTDLILEYTDGFVKVFADVHPDNTFSISNGTLSFEDRSGENIHYIPEAAIRNFHTICVRSHN